MEDVPDLIVPISGRVLTGGAEPVSEPLPPFPLEGGVELLLSSELGSDGGSGSLVNAKGICSASSSSGMAKPCIASA